MGWTDKITVGPPDSARHAAELLNQQIWCWGRDIEYAESNLLVRHGFQRIEKPAGSQAASLYRLDLSPTSRVILRGFGVFCGDDRWGGLFLSRFDFTPELTPEPDLPRPAWTLEDFPPLVQPREDQVPCCQRLMLMLIEWIRQYEVWIAERIGIAYRGDSLLEWNAKHGAVVPADEIAFSWQMLGAAVSDHPEYFIPTLHSRSRRRA